MYEKKNQSKPYIVMVYLLLSVLLVILQPMVCHSWCDSIITQFCYKKGHAFECNFIRACMSELFKDNQVFENPTSFYLASIAGATIPLGFVKKYFPTFAFLTY